MRKIFRGITDPSARFLIRIGFTPDTITFLGLIGHIGAAYLLGIGLFRWAGIVILLTAPFDAIDGTMARLLNKSTKFGGVLDSVTDRYSEIFLFGGLLFFYISQENLLVSILIYVAATGSIMVSYIRSRAETAGFDARLGLLSRAERYIVLVPCLILNIPVVGLWIVGILTHITAMQRMQNVRKQSAQNDKDSHQTIEV